MNVDFDVIVVGSRVAGSIVSTLLGMEGFRVLVLDRAQFPSDTLSTHFFRIPTIDAFRRIGISEAVLATAPRLVNNFNDVDGHVFTETVEYAEKPAFYLCVRRITLDALLVDRMRKEPGVTFRQGATVQRFMWENGVLTGVQWTEHESKREARARVVVGADGIHSAVAKEVKPAVENSEPVRRAMYYAYYKGLDPSPGPAAEFHYRGNKLVYVFPTDALLTLVAVSVPIEEFDSFRNDAQGRFVREASSMPQLAPRLATAEQVGPVRGTGSIPGYRRVPYGPGWALVGDSGMIMDPWSGQGIDQASTHAVTLAESLNRWLAGHTSWEEAMAEYHKRRNDFSVKTYERTCLYARDLRPMTETALKKRGIL